MAADLQRGGAEQHNNNKITGSGRHSAWHLKGDKIQYD